MKRTPLALRPRGRRGGEQDRVRDCACGEIPGPLIYVFRTTMRCTLAVTLGVLGLTLPTFAQSDPPTFKATTTSAFVWEEDSPSGAVSSSIRDSVTGHVIHKISHRGIEVSSRAGFESLGPGKTGEFLTFTPTILNHTNSEISVRPAGASFDGHLALPLSIVPLKKGFGEKEQKSPWALAKMHCFASGYFPSENFFSLTPPSDVFTVTPETTLTVSFVTKDPRNYSILCSVEGCYPKGILRFSITVNATDFVFIWPGRDVVDCGR